MNRDTLIKFIRQLSNSSYITYTLCDSSQKPLNGLIVRHSGLYLFHNPNDDDDLTINELYNTVLSLSYINKIYINNKPIELITLNLVKKHFILSTSESLKNESPTEFTEKTAKLFGELLD